MSDAAIQVRGLSKRYRISGRAPGGYRTIRESLTSALAAPFRRRAAGDRSASADFYALSDVSFDVAPGEVLGVVGRNGAGKSTLLKVLSRITAPTAGSVELRGRVGSLLEVGTGFHPELSGRENVFLSGAILGMSRQEIRRKFDEIVDFAELGQFVDTPVKRYSSGMYMRLAFAVAAHLESDILVVDEVLAVGDGRFQKKCLGKMGDVSSREGRTVLFVSHNMAAVQALCQRAIYLDRGVLTRHGPVSGVVAHYLGAVLPDAIAGTPLGERTDRRGDGRVRLASFHVEDADGNPVSDLVSGMDAVFVLGYDAPRGPVRNVDVGISVHSDHDQTLFVLYGSYVGQTFDVAGGRGQFRCRIPRLPLAAGKYRVGARVSANGEEADWPQDGVGFVAVEAGDFYGTGNRGCEGAAPILVDGRWEAR